MISYKIYTENKNINSIRQIVKSYFPQGATLYEAQGIFENNVEDSLVIEVIVDQSREADIVTLAKDIKFFNKQRAIKVTSLQLRSDINL